MKNSLIFKFGDVYMLRAKICKQQAARSQEFADYVCFEVKEKASSGASSYHQESTRSLDETGYPAHSSHDDVTP